MLQTYYIVENIEYALPFVVSYDELQWDDDIIDGPYLDCISALEALDDLYADIECAFGDWW